MARLFTVQYVFKNIQEIEFGQFCFRLYSCNFQALIAG